MFLMNKKLSSQISICIKLFVNMYKFSFNFVPIKNTKLTNN